ncbi:MAG: VIT and VWA domain-containing protein, partial [Planctomycetota bacterium]
LARTRAQEAKMTPVTHPSPTDATSHPGAVLVTPEGRALPLVRVSVDAHAAGGLGRTVLEQTFRNDGAEPLRVSYRLPLPAEAAVSGFAFELDGRRTIGEVKAKEDARRAFEQAVLEGRTAALLDEERSTLFEQELGNVPAGAEVVVSITIDALLAWLPSSGAWEWRIPTVVAPRYDSAPPEKAYLEIADRALAVDVALELRIEDALAADPASPSHAISVARDEAASRVGFDPGVSARLDRDIVVRWPVAEKAPVTSLRVERPTRDHARHDASFGLVTVVPPAETTADEVVTRDLIVLLDTSGSMRGGPLKQSVRVASRLVESLGDGDRLELIEFSQEPRRWREGAVRATAEERASALDWLARLRSGGGTEMRTGIVEALAPLSPESQRQVVIVSDGLITFEADVLAEVRDRLPNGSRVHSVGVGHGVNRSLTRGVARAGRGIERILTPGEPIDDAIDGLLRATERPVVVDVEVAGTALRGTASRVRDLFADVPVRLAVELDPAGGTLELVGRSASGPWRTRVDVPALDDATGDGALAALFARERVLDLEVLGAAERSRGSVEGEVERLGLDFQIATSRTSWVATSDEATVDPTQATRRVTMPHELAAGMSAEGLGLRPASASGSLQTLAALPMPLGKPHGLVAERASEEAFAPFEDAAPAPGVRGRSDSFVGRMKKRFAPEPTAPIVLVGQVRSFEPGTLVVEFEADRALEWDPDRVVKLELEDGRSVMVWVDREKSTARGPIGSGQVVRVVLTRVPEDAVPEALRLGDSPELVLRLRD